MMAELFSHSYLVIGGQETLTINARDLHERLGSQQQYANWIRNKIERGCFREIIDYLVFNTIIKNSIGGRPSIEYHITFYMAKHIALMENTDKGYEIRDYFIDCEERLRAIEGTSGEIHSELD